MTFPEKCPRCKALTKFRTDIAIRYVCGSVNDLGAFSVSDKCNLRCGKPTWRGVNRISQQTRKGM